MTFFIIIVIDNLADIGVIRAIFFFTIASVDSIEPNGWDEIFFCSTISFISLIVLFFLFLSFFEDLSIVGMLKSWRFQFLRLKLERIFIRAFILIGFRRLVALWALNIYFLNPE